MTRPGGLWGLTRYQWMVLLAAWVGWGFDVFDALLFNYVAPNCVPTLLGVDLGTPEARMVTGLWVGRLTSLLLLGWALGGILFGLLADRIGRTRTLLLTILLYSLGTAMCAFAPNIWFFAACRLLASLGIGGEWAAGAAMVAEVVPDSKRVQAGALLYTAAPVGIVLASLVNFQVAGHWLEESPASSWRVVFLFGLLPAAAALIFRMFLKEPELWSARAELHPPSFRDLLTPEVLPLTLSGLSMALVALISWWSVNAFIPFVADGLAQSWAARNEPGMPLTEMREHWKADAMNIFSLGGLVGTMLTVPASLYLGRRAMFAVYYLASAAAIMGTFGLPMDERARIYMFFFIGVTVFGVFGSFTYYLPELFPTRLRATGSGFCYNLGRILTALGPLAVGAIIGGGLESALRALFWVGLIPLLGLLALPWVVETRDRRLHDPHLT